MKKEFEKSNLNRIKRGQIRANYDKEAIHKILNENFLCYVAYVFEGYPISIPMAYGFDGNKVYLHGSQGNRLLSSILDKQKISITIMRLDGLVLARSGLHHSVNYHSVTLFGRVQKVEDDAKKEVALECVMEQMIKGRWNEIRKMHQKELDRTLVVEMTIETGSAKVRDVGVIDEPEDYNLNVWAGVVPIKQIAQYPIPDQDSKNDIPIPKHVSDYYEANKQ